MAPADRSMVKAETARLIYEEITRRFDEENRWRDELESKAGTFLGFVGVFLSILLLYGSSTQQAGAPFWPVLMLPTALQVGATLLLLAALYGHGQFAGPSVADVVTASAAEAPVLSLELADAYAFSIVSNRPSHAKAVAAYHLAVVLSAAGLVQLACAIAAWPIGSPPPVDLMASAWPFWIPGLGVVAVLSYSLYRGYAKDRRAAKELVYRLRRLAEARDDGKGGEG